MFSLICAVFIYSSRRIAHCVICPHLSSLWVKGQPRSWHDPDYCRVSGAEGFVCVLLPNERIEDS